MDNILLYIVKSTIALTILYGSYLAFFHRETFLGFNRSYIILAAFFSFILPLISIPLLFDLNPNPIPNFNFDRLILEMPGESTHIIKDSGFSSLSQINPVSLWHIIGILYLLGVIFFIFMFLLQLFQISRTGLKIGREVLEGFSIIQTTGNLPPFSFFKTIYINKKHYRPKDLDQILAHEKIHIEERHTCDLLLFEIIKIIHWFNPVIWVMNRSLRETHEFLADRGVAKRGYNTIAYQYLILKQASRSSAFSLVNTFTKSQTERRIRMLNKVKSKNRTLLKVLFIAPVLLILLTIYQVPSNAVEVTTTIENGLSYQFQPPLYSGRLTVGFEQMVNPFTKKSVFHKGWDIAVSQGTKIYACQSGAVVFADSINGHGNRIILGHSQDYSTSYSHLHKILVTEDQKVKTGDVIGLVGNTGLSTGPHLHFEIRLKDKVIDPGEKLDIFIYTTR